jgi:ABC-type iron transport system FetAB permease component
MMTGQILAGVEQADAAKYQLVHLGLRSPSERRSVTALNCSMRTT